MKKSNNLDFSNRKKQKKTIIVVSALIAAVLLAGVASFAVILAVNDFSLEKFFGTRAPESESTTAEPLTDINESESVPAFSDENALSFLFICHNDKKMSFCLIISASLTENTLRVKAVSPELMVSTAQIQGSLASVFEAGLAPAAVEALSLKGISISKYVCCTEAELKLIMQKLGPVDITVDRDLSYVSDGITYTLSKGVQPMTSEILLKYMTLADTGDMLLSVQAKAAAEVLKTHFTLANIDKGEDLFSFLINLCSTDITAFDYANCLTSLREFCAGAPKISAIS